MRWFLNKDFFAGVVENEDTEDLEEVTDEIGGFDRIGVVVIDDEEEWQRYLSLAMILFF